MKKLKGLGASGGVATGVVKIVTSVEDIGKVKEEHIVVTNNNSPLFSQAFIRAAAIISEKGGTLCHLAIVARELKKPCVVGVENATKILKEGTIVKVDGYKGEIAIINGQ
jgi:pyruvate,water dikinase